MTVSLLPAPTIWQPGVRVGSQTPRVRSCPEYVTTLGDEAADLMAEVGKPLLPWQREYCRDSLGRRADGKWSAYESGLFVARQNGKGVCIEARELYSLFILRTHRIIHSAHLFDTSREAFERLMEIIDGSDWLTKRVDKVNRAHGKEGIQLTARAGGGQLKYKARTLHGARGFSGEDIILDEAYALVAGHMAAISPILATLPNPSIGYFSSPPDDKTGPMPDDAFLPSVRKRGLEGQPRLAYWEFSPPDEFDPSDPEVRFACNPSAGYLIQDEYLEDQYRIFASAGKVQNYSTEHLGVWPVDTSAHWLVLAEADYLDLLDDASQATDPLVFSIDSTPGGGYSSISAAGARPDGNLHGEVIDHAQGTGWVVPRAVELDARWKPAAWVVDIGGAAGFMVPQLQEAGLNVVTLTPRQVGQAFAMFKAAASSEEQAEVVESSEELTGKPAGSLDEPFVVPKIKIRPGRHGAAIASAVEGATTRRIGDGTTWDRRSTDVVISPVVSMTNAVFGFVTREPAEPDQPFFGSWR